MVPRKQEKSLPICTSCCHLVSCKETSSSLFAHTFLLLALEVQSPVQLAQATLVVTLVLILNLQWSQIS